MPPSSYSYLSHISAMNRSEVLGAFNKWKWPVAGVAAAFVGSLYSLGFTQTFHLYAAGDGHNGKDVSGSFGVRGLLKKLIHDFLQNGQGPDKPPLSPSEASRIIRRNERRVDVNVGNVLYYDSNILPSNEPTEDRNAECEMLSSNGTLFSVIDGHGGYHCAEAVKKRLPLYVALALLKETDLTQFEKEIVEDLLISRFSDKSGPKTSVANDSSSDNDLSKKQDVFHTGPKYMVQALQARLENGCRLSMDEALSFAFTHLDDDIVTEAIPVKVLDDSFLAGASGACTIAAYIEGDQLLVANAGDCRAVLGSVNGDGSWVATPLSADQTANSREEFQRVWSQHPGEEATVIKNGRLLGQLQPLRAFGDIQYKWDRVTHNHILTQVYGGPIVPPHVYKSPPYLTAEPVVTKRQLRSKDRFLILATDGLWDSMSSDKAVELVGQFVNGAGRKSDVLEHNAASHLIRHAIGGNDHHFVAQMLLVPDQYRRMWRDDITVTVVFFNSEEVKISSQL